MKRTILNIGLALLVMQAGAQKIYQSKAGRVSFYSSAPLENIEAVNNQTDTKLGSNGQMTFMLAIKGFRFENATMQEHFNENYMESDKYPKAVFMGTISNLSNISFDKDGTYTATVNGDMQLHGVKKKVIANGTIEVKGGKVSVKSKFKLKLEDYNIKGAWIGEKIAKEVEVTVDCKYD